MFFLVNPFPNRCRILYKSGPVLRSAPSRLEEPHPSGLGNWTPNVHQETPRGAGWYWNWVGEHIELWPLTNPMMPRFLLWNFRVAFWLEGEWWRRRCDFYSLSCCCCCCSCSIWFGPTFIASGLDSHPGRPGGACVRGRASVRRAAGDLGVWQVKDQTGVLFHHWDEIDQIFPWSQAVFWKLPCYDWETSPIQVCILPIDSYCAGDVQERWGLQTGWRAAKSGSWGHWRCRMNLWWLVNLGCHFVGVVHVDMP